MHYYQFNIGDYIGKTAHLTVAEDCIYRRLIDMYYDTERPIPAETKAVIRRLRLNNLDEELASVLSEFFRLEGDNCWHHERIDRDISAYKAKADRARNNGKLGGRPVKTKVVISENPDETQSKANHKPLTINQEPIKKRASPFIPPSLEEVTAYVATRTVKINPQSFIDHYEANGWMRGKTKIKDWKACVRTWETNNRGNGNGAHQQDNSAVARVRRANNFTEEPDLKDIN